MRSLLVLVLAAVLCGCANTTVQRNWVVESHPRGFYSEGEREMENFNSKEKANARAQQIAKLRPNQSVSVYAHGIVFVPKPQPRVVTPIPEE